MRTAVGLALLGLALLAGPAVAGPGGAVSLRVTGRVVRVVAVGGETTGWALDLDVPARIEDREMRRLEAEPADVLARFEGRRIAAAGTLVWRTAVERGRDPVLHLDQVGEATP